MKSPASRGNVSSTGEDRQFFGVFDATQNIVLILYTTNVNVQEAARNISQELTLNARENLR
jgi:hypothetical protein